MNDAIFCAKFIGESNGSNGVQFTFEVLNKEKSEEINVTAINLNEDEIKFISTLKEGNYIELHFPNQDDLNVGDPIVIIPGSKT